MIGKYHLGFRDGALWPLNRGFDTSEGFHFSGFWEGNTGASGAQDSQGYFDWSHGAGTLRQAGYCSNQAASSCNNANHNSPQDSRACNTTNWYDVIINDQHPENTSPADTQVSWDGYKYINEGRTHMNDTTREINTRFWQLYKDRAGKGGVSAAAAAAAAEEIRTYHEAMGKTRNIIKTMEDATVNAIVNHQGPDPFFIYTSTPAMRFEGIANDDELTRTFNTMYEKIEECDNARVDATTGHYEPGTAMHALKALVDDPASGQTWADVNAQIENAWCTDLRKQARFRTHAFAASVDDLLNASVAALYRKGLWDNTMIVFTADNGAWSGGNAWNWPLR